MCAGCRRFLCWKQEQAGGQPPAGCREKLAGCLWRVRAFAASVQGSLGALLHMALAGCFFHETQGVLKGFVQIGGAHYPRYAYCAPDGRVFDRAGGCWPLAGRSRPACRGGGAAAKKLPRARCACNMTGETLPKAGASTCKPYLVALRGGLLKGCVK